MATQLFVNNFRTTVAATFGSSDTTLQLASAAGLPATLTGGDYYVLTIFKVTGVEESAWEQVKVTARTGTQCTVERVWEAGTPAQFLTGDIIEMRWTAKAAALKADKTDVDLKMNKGGDTTTGTIILGGAVDQLAAVITNMAEKIALVNAGATGTISMNIVDNSIVFYTASAASNWLLNIRGDATHTLNSLMSTGQALTVAMLAAQGTTAYMPTVFQIDGTTVTPKWQGNAAPTGGNASGIDVYGVTIIKTGNNVFTVLVSQSQFKQ